LQGLRFAPAFGDRFTAPRIALPPPNGDNPNRRAVISNPKSRI
jgi:hypothetical protein